MIGQIYLPASDELCELRMTVASQELDRVCRHLPEVCYRVMASQAQKCFAVLQPRGPNSGKQRPKAHGGLSSHVVVSFQGPVVCQKRGGAPFEA